MNRETSVYLDILRLSAAMVVFLGHISGVRLTGGMLWQFGPYMSQAVTGFFVLSGFVIGYVTDGREATPTVYATSRLARIYSVALPTLVLTFLLDAIGCAINGSAYSAVWGYQADGKAWQFLSGLLFVNQLWFLSVPQGSDLPYWSLGYEVWYYLIFGLLVFTRQWKVWAMLAMLFPLWLLGVGAYRARRVPVGVAAGTVLWLGTTAAWLGYELWAVRHGRLVGLVPMFLRRPELAQDYLMGILLAVHLVGFRAASPLFAVPIRRIAPAVRWAAGMTFTLYLLHLPVAQFLMATSPWPLTSMQNRALILLGTLAIIVIVAEFTERRKALWRRGFEQLLARVPMTQRAKSSRLR